MRFGRRRLVGAGVLCSSASALWIAPAAVFPGAELSPLLVVVGVGIPFGVGALVLSLMERRIVRELQPAQRRLLPEHDRVGVR